MKNFTKITLAGMCLALFVSFSPFAFAAEKKDVVTPQMCDARTDPREKEICLIGLKIQLDEQIKKAKKEREKKEPPALKEARKLVEKGEKNDRDFQKKENRLKKRAAVDGCPWDTEEFGSRGVWVSPKALKEATVNAMASLTITNSTPFPYDIRTSDSNPGHVIVRRLCAGASITVTFPIAWNSGDCKDIMLTGTAHPANGRNLKETTRVNVCWVQSRRNEPYTWEITTGRQY